jgi:hypothetical protein
MKTQALQFNDILEKVYNLHLEDKLELKNLLEHNIAEARRDEIAENFIKAQEEYHSGELQFSSEIKELKKML